MGDTRRSIRSAVMLGLAFSVAFATAFTGVAVAVDNPPGEAPGEWARFYRSAEGDRCGGQNAKIVYDLNDPVAVGMTRARKDDCDLPKSVVAYDIATYSYLLSEEGTICAEPEWKYNTGASTSIGWYNYRDDPYSYCANMDFRAKAKGRIWKPAHGGYETSTFYTFSPYRVHYGN